MIIGLDWVTYIFQIPFLVPLFGLITLSVVIGFRGAIATTLIGAVPSFIQTIVDIVAFSSNKTAIIKGIAISQNCNGKMKCFMQSLGNPTLNWVAQFLPQSPYPISPFLDFAGQVTAFIEEFIILPCFIYFAIRSILKFRKDLKQRLGNKYRFKR